MSGKPAVAPCRHHRRVSGWSPWEAVGRMPHVEVRRVDLPPECGGEVTARRGERTWVLLDRGLTRAERRSTLTHALVHLERGTARSDHMPATWDAVVVREEHIVDGETARRLIPLDDLSAFVDRQVELGEPVHAIDVAAEWDVTLRVANRALHLLDQRRSR